MVVKTDLMNTCNMSVLRGDTRGRYPHPIERKLGVVDLTVIVSTPNLLSKTALLPSMVAP